jgi:hypothetical protein
LTPKFGGMIASIFPEKPVRECTLFTSPASIREETGLRA